MARQVVIRYKVKAERLAEHEGLVRDVFAELARTVPAGLHYGAFRQADGLSFVHVAMVSVEKNPLDSLPAFKAFTERIRERIEEPPQVTELTTVGAYGILPVT